MKLVSLYSLNDMNTLKEITAERLAEFKFAPCTAMQSQSIGFAPNTVDKELVSNVNGDLFLRIATQNKTVQKNYVEYLVEQKAKVFFKEHGDQPILPKVIKKQFTEEAQNQALSEAFPQKEKYIEVVFTKDGLILVEAKGKKAEDALALIRKAIGSLPVSPIQTENPITDLLDTWVKTDVDTEFTLGDKVKVASKDNEDAILKNCAVGDTKAAEYLKEGGYVLEVQVNYDGFVDFNIDEAFTLTGIKFSKEFKATCDCDATATLLQVEELKNIIGKIVTLLTNK